MYCPVCAANLADNAQFCHRCGERLSGEASKTPRTFQADSPPAAADAPPPASVRDPSAKLSPRTELLKNDQEQTLWTGGYSFKAMMPAVLGLALLSIAALVGATLFFFTWPIFGVVLAVIAVCWLALALRYGWMRLDVKYTLTNQRFAHEEGVFRRITDRVETIDINDVRIKQSLIDRMFGVGKIRITSSDQTHPELILYGIDNVREVADQIDKARRAERIRRGLHIASV